MEFIDFYVFLTHSALAVVRSNTMGSRGHASFNFYYMPAKYDIARYGQYQTFNMEIYQEVNIDIADI